MKRHLKTTARFVAGIIFLALGVVGSLLPVLQGWLFFLLAALMFFPNHPRAERGLRKLEPRLPRFVGLLRRMGFGRVEDELANLDVGEWVHEHQPFHHHEPAHADIETIPPSATVAQHEAEERERQRAGR